MSICSSKCSKLTIMRRNQALSSASSIVPFRESKLTHLFMNHLTGPSANRTMMIVNVNPAAADFDETQHVLAYATAARTVQISQEEFNRKRKDTSGGEMDATHDYNGRALKKKKVDKEPVSKSHKIANLVRQFSPKQLMAKKNSVADGRKRKVAEARKPPLSKAGSSSSLTSKDDEPKQKVSRLASMRGLAKPKETGALPPPGSLDKELKNLKTSLSIAQAEAEVLRSEKNELEEELAQRESQVRMEIAEEMEEQMRVTREQYNGIIENLKRQVQTKPTPAKSAKKAQMDKAELYLEELVDKVDQEMDSSVGNIRAVQGIPEIPCHRRKKRSPEGRCPQGLENQSESPDAHQRTGRGVSIVHCTPRERKLYGVGGEILAIEATPKTVHRRLHPILLVRRNEELRLATLRPAGTERHTGIVRRHRSQYPVNTGQVVIGGVSAGGAMAIDVSIDGVIPTAGFIGVCPGKPTEFDKMKVRMAREKNIKGVIIGGEEDENLPSKRKWSRCFVTSISPTNSSSSREWDVPTPAIFHRRSTTRSTTFFARDSIKRGGKEPRCVVSRSHSARPRRFSLWPGRIRAERADLRSKLISTFQFTRSI